MKNTKKKTYFNSNKTRFYLDIYLCSTFSIPFLRVWAAIYSEKKGKTYKYYFGSSLSFDMTLRPISKTHSSQQTYLKDDRDTNIW